MTLMAAARTSTQSAAFEIVSIVPSISRAWTTLPTTMTIANGIWTIRHVCARSPNRRRSAAMVATAKMAHMTITPKGENGVGDDEEKGVNHIGRAGDPEAPDVDHHRHDQRAADPVMGTPSTISRQSRQVSANQQGLNEHKTERDDPCETGQYVERIAPCQQRARRSGGKRHANGYRKGGPDQGYPGQSHPCDSNPVRPAAGTKCASRLVSFALRMIGRRKTVLNSPLS